jgi:hypothetical protein
MPKRLRGTAKPAVLSTESRAMASREPAGNAEGSRLRLSEQPDAPPATEVAPILSVDEASARYVGEWVLMQVTGTDSRTHRSQGKILVHSPLRKDISRVIRRVHKRDPDVHLYVFKGGMRYLTGDALRAALEEAANRSPYVNTKW